MMFPTSWFCFVSVNTVCIKRLLAAVAWLYESSEQKTWNVNAISTVIRNRLFSFDEFNVGRLSMIENGN